MPPPPTVAQRVVEAILSPVRLLSPALRSPGKSTRYAHTQIDRSIHYSPHPPYPFQSHGTTMFLPPFPSNPPPNQNITGAPPRPAPTPLTSAATPPGPSPSSSPRFSRSRHDDVLYACYTHCLCMFPLSLGVGHKGEGAKAMLASVSLFLFSSAWKHRLSLRWASFDDRHLTHAHVDIHTGVDPGDGAAGVPGRDRGDGLPHAPHAGIDACLALLPPPFPSSIPLVQLDED